MGRLKKRLQPSLQPPNRKTWPPIFNVGWFRAANIFLNEAAINNVVVRIPLGPEPLVPVTKPQKPPPVRAKRFVFTSKVKKRPISISREKKRLVNSSRFIQVKPLKPPVRRSKVENGVKSVVKNGQSAVVKKPEPSKSKKVQNVEHSNMNHMLSRLTVDFVELSDLVCVMKLPSETWKVTVLMNHDFTTVFKFVNQAPSKIVSFAQTNPYYSILIEGVSVALLGCPKTVDSLRDIEILLEIVNRLDLRDCMVAKL